MHHRDVMHYIILQNQHEFLVSKPIKSSNPSNVPAFASGLGTTLEPLKAGKNEPKKEVEEPLKVPNAITGKKNFFS